jgi:hypothetical protein
MLLSFLQSKSAGSANNNNVNIPLVNFTFPLLLGGLEVILLLLKNTHGHLVTISCRVGLISVYVGEMFNAVQYLRQNYYSFLAVGME